MLLLWTLQVAFAAAHIFTSGLLVLPKDWDSLMYHIPLVDQWHPAHTLCAGLLGLGNPGNSELMGLWVVASCPATS